MKITKKSLALSSITVLISVLVIFSVVKAGSLTPTGAPAGTFYTLNNIYTRLTVGTAATEGSHNFGPSASPAGTMHTLTDIYGAIPGGPGTTVTATTSSGTAIPAGCYSGTPKCMVGLTGGTGTAAANAQVLSGYSAYTSNGTVLNGTAQEPLVWQAAPWAISTSYVVGNEVADSSDNSWWLCAVAHTSGTGTFAADRTAYPSYWTSTTPLSLCWSNAQLGQNDGADPNCAIGAGLVSATGNSSNPLGAVEYCKYLNAVGVMQTTEQDIWRLPTESELLAGLSDQFVLALSTQVGFQYGTSYWSGSPHGSSNAWYAYYNLGAIRELSKGVT